MNISMLLEMAADTYGDRIALTCADHRISYTELLAAARHVAAQVQGSGVSYLGHLAVSSPAAPIGLFAAAIAGVPYVPMNYRLTAEEISALLARIEPALLVADTDYVSKPTIPAGITVIDRGAFVADALSGGGAIDAVAGEEDVAVQLFTSGTTGQPKAAILRHANLFSYIIGSVDFASAEEEESTLVSVPPYHIAGVSAVMSSIYAGRRIVQLPNFDPAEWLRLCRTENVTNAFVVPTMLSRIVEHLDKAGETADVPALRAIAYGGGRMPLSVVERAMALFKGVNLTNAYGLTETSSTVCLLGPDDHREAASSDDPQIRRRLTSVGRALPSIELEVRDEEGTVVGPEAVGRVHVRGPQVSGEYGGTGSLLDAEGWFDTRDCGFVDSDGYLFLDGRADDVIVRGGENISPGEIEEVLIAHADVADVAVVGIPDEDWGEAVAAAIVLADGSEADAAALQELVRTKLRSSRVPQQIRFVDELPYNELGKLLRRVVRTGFD
jgi:long-chain acyl-CoA synthetase